PVGRAGGGAPLGARLELAGARDVTIFTPDALARVAEVTEGIPRVVNVLCDACLVTGYASETRPITRAVVDEAWADYAALSNPAGAGEPAPHAFPAPPAPTAEMEPAAAPKPEPLRIPEPVAAETPPPPP